MPSGTYDAKGNLTSDGTNTYQWNARDQLIQISGAVTASFTYDGLGRRTSKTVNGRTTQFVYDGRDIVGEMDSQAGLVTYLQGLNIDEPFIRQTVAGNEFYHQGALGSTLALSNDAGTATTRYTYDPFGNTTVTGASSNALQYTSRKNDGTGLYYYRARYYSPTLNRFISEDPIGLAGGDSNFYAYVGNSPLGFRDPFGLEKKGCAAGGQSTTVANIAIKENTLTVDLNTTGFDSGSDVSIDVNNGRLRSDQNPGGQNRVNFNQLYRSGTGVVGADGNATINIPLSDLHQGQYLQINPQRLESFRAPVITPFVGEQGSVRPCKDCDDQVTYDSECQ